MLNLSDVKISAPTSGSAFDRLIAQFASEDGAVRERAREAIVHVGKPAVEKLVSALQDPHVRVRWEATRALCEIADPSTAPALVGRLEGQDAGVRWMAADGLIAMGVPALEPLLQALLERSDSVLLRQGAHRVLYGLAGRSGLQPILTPVIRALDAMDPSVVVPIEAYKALGALREARSARAHGITIRKILVRHWMSPSPVTVSPGTRVADVDRLLKERQIRRVPVVDDGALAGIVSLGDLREAREQHESAPVEQIMTREVITVRPDDTLRVAAQRMLEHKIGGLPVLDKGELVGIITESDIFRVLVQELPAAHWE